MFFGDLERKAINEKQCPNTMSEYGLQMCLHKKQSCHLKVLLPMMHRLPSSIGTGFLLLIDLFFISSEVKPMRYEASQRRFLSFAGEKKVLT